MNETVDRRDLDFHALENSEAGIIKDIFSRSADLAALEVTYS